VVALVVKLEITAVAPVDQVVVEYAVVEQAEQPHKDNNLDSLDHLVTVLQAANLLRHRQQVTALHTMVEVVEVAQAVLAFEVIPVQVQILLQEILGEVEELED
jgi:hypothetical protein